MAWHAMVAAEEEQDKDALTRAPPPSPFRIHEPQSAALRQTALVLTTLLHLRAGVHALACGLPVHAAGSCAGACGGRQEWGTSDHGCVIIRTTIGTLAARTCPISRVADASGQGRVPRGMERRSGGIGIDDDGVVLVVGGGDGLDGHAMHLASSCRRCRHGGGALPAAGCLMDPLLLLLLLRVALWEGGGRRRESMGDRWWYGTDGGGGG